MGLEILKDKMYHAKLKPKDLAILIGKCETTARRKLNGEIDFSKPEMLKIKDWLNLSMKEFFNIFFDELVA